jgi:hypothetical protein
MKPPIKNSTKRFWLIFPILLAALVWTVGCATQTPDPLTGWHFYSRTKVSQAITDDYQDYIQTLSLNRKQDVGDVSFFEDGTGQHAVSIEIFGKNKSASWHYAIIYDKENKRIKVIKYGYRTYMS